MVSRNHFVLTVVDEDKILRQEKLKWKVVTLFIEEFSFTTFTCNTSVDLKLNWKKVADHFFV